MIAALTLLLIPFMAWLDRQRGDPRGIPKIIALIGLGACVSILTKHYIDWRAPIIVAAVAISYNVFGWGQAIGYAITGRNSGKYAPWQIGTTLKFNPWLALAVRGALIGICSLAALDVVAAIKITLAFAVAFPLAPYLAVHLFRKAGDDAWALMEYIRGFMAGLILWVL